MLSLCEQHWSLEAIAQQNETAGARGAPSYARHHTAAFVRLGTVKTALLLALLKPGFSVLLSDADVIWVDGAWRRWMLPTAADLLPEATLLSMADVLISTDELDAAEDAADLSHGPGDQGWLSFGM